MAAVTVESVARDVAAIVGVDNDLALVGNWVVRRWQEIANSTTLRALRRTGELVIEAPYATGTVAVTKGSATVTGTGTAFDNSHVGRIFRASQAWYEIAQVASATSLVLKSEYSEDSASSAGFNIVQHRHELADDVRKLGPFVHMRLRRPLDMVSRIGLDLADSSRYQLSSVPRYVAEQEPTATGVKRVEIYPYSSQQEIVHYLYWAEPGPLGFRDYIPGPIDIEALREGVLVDVYRHLANKFAMEDKINAAGYYRNEARAQETSWKNVHKKRLMQQDDALDDLEFILLSRPAHPRDSNTRAINDAYSQIWYS